MTSTFWRLRGIWNIAWNRSVQPFSHLVWAQKYEIHPRWSFIDWQIILKYGGVVNREFIWVCINFKNGMQIFLKLTLEMRLCLQEERVTVVVEPTIPKSDILLRSDYQDSSQGSTKWRRFSLIYKIDTFTQMETSFQNKKG